MRDSAILRPLELQSDEVLLAAARGNQSGAFEVLFERHSKHVLRVLARILGQDPDLPDSVNDVFLILHRSLGRVPSDRLRGYLTATCVNVAKNRLRSRRRARWLTFGDPPSEQEPMVTEASDEREALHATYRVLDTMDASLRICFALRFIDGLELTEVGAALGVSLATTKRWLQRAESQFSAHAEREASLQPWLERGLRRGGPS